MKGLKDWVCLGCGLKLEGVELKANRHECNDAVDGLGKYTLCPECNWCGNCDEKETNMKLTFKVTIEAPREKIEQKIREVSPSIDSKRLDQLLRENSVLEIRDFSGNYLTISDDVESELTEVEL
jgi:hypothetical protein